MTNPWAFGWTQVLTVTGLIITVAIAIGGFRSFQRWKKEKIEEKRIDTAIEALALVYESKLIFEHIRSPMSFPYEWEDMPKSYGTTDGERSARGPFYAILKRIQASKDFFDRAWKMQVRCAALFGPQVEDVFLLMQRARREIEVSAEMLLHDPEPTVKSEDNIETWKGSRADVWASYGSVAKQGDQVGNKVSEFKERMERLCRPIIDREFGKERRKGIIGRAADWLGM